MPSVEPMPRPPSELRLSVPLDAQEASYLAASARMASFCWRSMAGAGYWMNKQYFAPAPRPSRARRHGPCSAHGYEQSRTSAPCPSRSGETLRIAITIQRDRHAHLLDPEDRTGPRPPARRTPAAQPPGAAERHQRRDAARDPRRGRVGPCRTRLHVIVVEGAGKGFCGGYDLAHFGRGRYRPSLPAGAHVPGIRWWTTPT